MKKRPGSRPLKGHSTRWKMVNNCKTIQVLSSQLCLCNFQFSTPYPRFPGTSFAYFPAIIICICEIFPAHCDSNSILIFRAQCNLQFAFFYDLFCQDRAPLYWSHNRTKWYEKTQHPMRVLWFAFACAFYGVPIFDRWCVKIWDEEGRKPIFAYLINLFGFLGGFLWKNNKHFIVCSVLGEWVKYVLWMAYQIKRIWTRKEPNGWGREIFYFWKDPSKNVPLITLWVEANNST